MLFIIHNLVPFLLHAILVRRNRVCVVWIMKLFRVPHLNLQYPAFSLSFFSPTTTPALGIFSRHLNVFIRSGLCIAQPWRDCFWPEIGSTLLGRLVACTGLSFAYLLLCVNIPPFNLFLSNRCMSMYGSRCKSGSVIFTARPTLF